LSTQFDSSLFADIADTLGLGNPAIVEKDYYVVQLLTLICALKLEHHQIVFSGGTALAKSSVKTNRMSEDVDLKLAVNQSFLDLPSRNAKRNSRKVVMQVVESMIESSKTFSIEKRPLILDEYRYFSFDIRYPQEYQ
jgi:predicted nucleotidyltransferase component of viral defense system